MESQTLLGDRYRIRGVLGEGDRSIVLLATDLRLGRDVAVKVLRTALLADAGAVARFRREADNACALDHPGIIGVYDTGANDAGAGPVPFMVVEYVDGDTLQTVIERDGSLPVARALQITSGILEALEFAHRHGIVHRSLSAATVMLDRGGAPKLMDFGLGVGHSQALAALQCASPEQLTGAPVDARSDVYSCGCLLWQMLTGRPLFDADSPVAVAQQHLSSSADLPVTARPDLPADVDSVVRMATRTLPLDRYQTATQMRGAVRVALRRQLLPAFGPTGNAAVTAALSANPDTSPTLAPPLLQPPDVVTPVSRPVTSGAPGAGINTDVDTDIDTDDPDRRPRGVWTRYLLAAVCALLLGAAAVLTVIVLTAPPPPAMVAVPDLSGHTLEQATDILRGSGLTLGPVEKIESADASKGRVVDQRPSRLTQVDPDTVVSVEIGRGVTVVAAPNLVGSTGPQARARLATLKLEYAEKLKASSDADKGKVIAQDAAAQSPLRPGATVTVTIGTGLNLVTVPDGLIGKNVDAARAVLRSAGLTMVAQEGDGAAPVNEVIGLDQPAGRRIPQGTPVTVTVSNNTLMVMPGLTGRPQDAVAALRKLGWAGDLGALAVSGQPTPDAAAVGMIVAQQPAPGSVVRKIGTPVRVGIGVKQLTMPSLIGRTQQQAVRALARAGATNLSFIDSGAGPRGRSGRVATQSVPAGTPVAADTPLVIGIFTR